MALAVVFGGLVTISTGTLLLLSISNTLDATRSSLAARLENLLNDAEQQSRNFFNPMEGNGRWLADQIVTGKVDPKDLDRFRSVLIGATAMSPQIAAVSYQHPDGSGYFYDVATEKLDEVDWPQKWQARLNRTAENRPVWPPKDGIWVLRPSVMDGAPAGTFLAPARTPEGDIGVIGIRRDSTQLSKSLAIDADFRGHELVRFILFNKRVVIGHPKLREMGDQPWPSIKAVNDPYLLRLNKAERNELNLVADIPGVDIFSIETEKGPRVFATKIDKTRASGGELMIGIHFDAQAGATELNRLITIAVVGIALLVGSILVAILLGNRAAMPMGRLSRAASLVQGNKLDQVEELPPSRIRELSAASSAFNEMVDGLKERETIRDLFGKYVPGDVATLLLADGTNAKPRNAIATAFFLDIEGFTRISERLEPSELVATINAFFSDAVAMIEAQGGMVTQFQGDAIIAVFNIPIEYEDHAQRAIRAALSIVQRTSETTYEREKLNCRIGINTGPIVAGAIGAEDRLSYTVYGDAVNIAARLEQMNKEFGTNILVSSDTINALNTDDVSDLEFNEMGSLPIRGRDAPVSVFTPSKT